MGLCAVPKGTAARFGGKGQGENTEKTGSLGLDQEPGSRSAAIRMLLSLRHLLLCNEGTEVAPGGEQGAA